jgi:hypothetical protein
MKKRFGGIVKKCMHAFLKTVNLKSTKVLARDNREWKGLGYREWNDREWGHREKYGYPNFCRDAVKLKIS